MLCPQELTEEEQAVQNSLLQRERSRREDAEMSKVAAAPSDSSGPASPVKAAGQTSAAFGDASFGATPAGTAAVPAAAGAWVSGGGPAGSQHGGTTARRRRPTLCLHRAVLSWTAHAPLAVRARL